MSGSMKKHDLHLAVLAGIKREIERSYAMGYNRISTFVLGNHLVAITRPPDFWDPYVRYSMEMYR